MSLREVLSGTNWEYIALGIFSAFKSFWLILLLGVPYLKKRLPVMIYVVTLLSIVVIGISVFDFSRSISYGFMGILIIIFEIYKAEVNPAGFKKLVFILLMTSMLDPVLSVRGQGVDIIRPLYVKFFDRLRTESWKRQLNH